MNALTLAVDAVDVGTSLAVFFGTGLACWLGYRPLRDLIVRQEQYYDEVLRRRLLVDISPRSVTLLSVLGMGILALLGYAIGWGLLGVFFGMALGIGLPPLFMHLLRKQRLERLESQLVPGIQTLAAGVRAGLNLIQSFQLLGRDGPVPLRQEINHLLREYEYGMPLEETMNNAASRIGSGDYRLLFAALQTHRERGGDLGQTLDRIGESIREIQRLESRVKTLTAEGRATARWLGAMPVVIGGIFYLIDPSGIRSLFHEPLGNVILVGVVVMNIIGFVWIRKIMSVDI